MKIFECPACSSNVWFDNQTCEHCGTVITYDIALDAMVGDSIGCINRYTEEQCNWSADADVCASCALDLDRDPSTLRRPFQQAKRRVLRQLTQFGVAFDTRTPQLRFDLREGTTERPVTTGHADGLITIDTSEGNPADLEELRVRLGEPYRTPLGHVRHEVGHWWWATAMGVEFGSDEFRDLFGLETVSYSEALSAHYSSIDDGSWRNEYVSFYAASHPWEDFAESFAHVLHLSDTLETAVAHDASSVGPQDGFRELYSRWVRLTIGLNELTRSMGVEDAYPFAPSATAVDKFAFVADRLPRAVSGQILGP